MSPQTLTQAVAPGTGPGPVLCRLVRSKVARATRPALPVAPGGWRGSPRGPPLRPRGGLSPDRLRRGPASRGPGRRRAVGRGVAPGPWAGGPLTAAGEAALLRAAGAGGAAASSAPPGTALRAGAGRARPRGARRPEAAGQAGAARAPVTRVDQVKRRRTRWRCVCRLILAHGAEVNDVARPTGLRSMQGRCVSRRWIACPRPCRRASRSRGRSPLPHHALPERRGGVVVVAPGRAEEVPTGGGPEEAVSGTQGWNPGVLP